MIIHIKEKHYSKKKTKKQRNLMINDIIVSMRQLVIKLKLNIQYQIRENRNERKTMKKINRNIRTIWMEICRIRERIKERFKSTENMIESNCRWKEKEKIWVLKKKKKKYTDRSTNDQITLN
jgi:hypothetical protein